MERRCEITTHPCGTDTWGSLTPCKCRQCQAWLMEYCNELEQDRAGANANSRDQILRIKSLEVKNMKLRKALEYYRDRGDRPHVAREALLEEVCT